MKFFCYLYMLLTGWKYKSVLPPELKSFVMIGAPHTSNYDFLPAMALLYNLKKNARFVIKDSWTKFPMSLFMIPIGGIGLNRDKIKESGNQSTTDLMANLFKREKDLVLLIAPEGTRKKVTEWKTGFYYIAQKANVPLVLAFGDHRTKTYGVGKVIYPTEHDKDMKVIMDYFKSIEGYDPDKFSIDLRYQ